MSRINVKITYPLIKAIAPSATKKKSPLHLSKANVSLGILNCICIKYVHNHFASPIQNWMKTVILDFLDNFFDNLHISSFSVEHAHRSLKKIKSEIYYWFK